MLKPFLFLFLLCSIFSFCFSQDVMKGKGVLRVNMNKFDDGEGVRIYNQDGTYFGEVYREPRHHEPTLKFTDPKKKKEDFKVREYYPDYGLLIFESEQLASGNYPVYIGNQIKYIKASDPKGFISFETWPVFIKSIFVQPTAFSDVFTDTTAKKNIKGAKEYSYRILKMAGDWIHVECLKTCEDCPPDRIIRGWIRWRNGNKLLVDLYYFC